MRLFAECFEEETLARWQKAIRKVTAGLGEARDRDVQIEFLCDVLDELEDRADYPGIARVMVRLERDRAKVQPKVLKALDRLEAGGVVQEISAAMKKALAKLEKKEVTAESPYVFRQGASHILSRLEELLAYEDCLGREDDQERHHAMRIAAKRLRYTMEILKPAYGDELKEFIASIKEVQTLLGDLHDCDVWVEHLQELLELERAKIVKRYGHDRPAARLQVGIDHLCQRRRGQRKELFAKLVDYWAELKRQRIWESLIETVESHANPAGRPASPEGSNGEQDRRETPPWTGAEGDPSGDGGRPAVTVPLEPSSAK
jgi:CHAD domain-containing protein